MKLAEALQERSDLNVRIKRLEDRMMNNALVQEGEQPSEDPAELQRELDDYIGRLTWLVSRINLTNCATSVDGQTLTEMIARKDSLVIMLSIYRRLVNTAGNTAGRVRHSEIKILSTVPVAELQKQADSMAKELRLLDNKLQETNWTTELIENEK